MLDSQVHVISCLGYKELRVGRAWGLVDGDLESYFRDVLLAREKIKDIKK